MHPFFDFLGRRIPAYGASGAVGFLLSFLYVCLRSKKLKISSAAPYIYVTGAICAMVGAKILYLLTAIPAIVSSVKAGQSVPDLIRALLSGGLVFYGGLIGAVTGAYFACRPYKCRLSEFFRVFMPAICIFHGFGRIGCFLAGCCYGKATSGPFGIIFQNSEFAPKGTPLIPVQLIEAAGIFLLFLILHICSGQCRSDFNMFLIYISVYAPLRFILEFARGDTERGFIGPLSTSQWISLLLFAAVWIFYCANKKKVQI